jgi:hypothetical protein
LLCCCPAALLHAATCPGAPSGVTLLGGASFSTDSWTSACGSTSRGLSCTASSACVNGTGSITAVCEPVGVWSPPTGNCTGELQPFVESLRCSGMTTTTVWCSEHAACSCLQRHHVDTKGVLHQTVYASNHDVRRLIRPHLQQAAWQASLLSAYCICHGTRVT